MIKVSVIIPVYNAEKFLAECIETLIGQTEPACEFIFVNDGSTDRSLEIIESFQLKDNRIALISQPNQGISAARNAGIAVATGEYLGFVDADDFIARDMFETLYHKAKLYEADISMSAFYTEQRKSKLTISFDFDTDETLNRHYIRHVIMPYFIKKDLLNTACNKIFRRDMILKNEIDFPNGVALGEDAVFNMKALNVAETACYSDYAGYHYREVSGSATRNITDNKYFAKALDAYHFDYRALMDLPLGGDEYNWLRQSRLIDSVLSLTYLYLTDKKAKLIFKIASVKEMINNKEVVAILRTDFSKLLVGKSAYNRFLLKSIKNKAIFRIYFATLYSQIRNA